MITLYCGEKVRTTKRSKYLISNGMATLDYAPSPHNKIYVGGNIANNPNCGKKEGGSKNYNSCNAHFDWGFSIVGLVDIKKGDIILIDYNYNGKG